jgi:hypothetical protein
VPTKSITLCNIRGVNSSDVHKDIPLMILWNSAAGSLTLHLYSVSGMPKCSDSISISFNSNSDTRS